MLLDTILTDLGDFGVSQVVIYCLFGPIFLSSAWQNLGITFIGGEMDHWCYIQTLSNLTYQQQKYIAIPFDGEADPQSYSECEMFDLDYSNYSTEELLAWNRSVMTSGADVISCDSWVYDQSLLVSSIVSQWDLVCGQRHLVSLVQTLYFVGFLTGCVVFGQMSDRVGRRRTMLLSLLLWVGGGLIAVFIPNYIAYVIFRFLTGSSVAGAFTTAFVYAMEVIGPKWRTTMGILVQVWFSVGIMIASGIAYVVRDHTYLQIVLAASIIPLWLVVWFVPESPRWLITMGRDEEAEGILRRFAEINKVTLPEKLDLEENRKQSSVADQSASLIDLLRSPKLRFITLNMWFCWFASSLGYYGLSLGVSLLGGSIYFNSFLSGVAEIPGILIAMVLMEKVGRRWPTVLCLLATGVCCLICMIFVDNQELEVLLTVFLMTGKVFSAGLFAIIYIYAAEIFPTVVRNVGVGSSSMVARVGSLLQPQVANLDTFWPQSQFLIYGVISVIGSATSYFFPETKGQKLPESLEEAENWSRKTKKSPEDTDVSGEVDYSEGVRF